MTKSGTQTQQGGAMKKSLVKTIAVAVALAGAACQFPSVYAADPVDPVDPTDTTTLAGELVCPKTNIIHASIDTKKAKDNHLCLMEVTKVKEANWPVTMSGGDTSWYLKQGFNWDDFTQFAHDMGDKSFWTEGTKEVEIPVEQRVIAMTVDEWALPVKENIIFEQWLDGEATAPADSVCFVQPKDTKWTAADICNSMPKDGAVPWIVIFVPAKVGSSLFEWWEEKMIVFHEKRPCSKNDQIVVAPAPLANAEGVVTDEEMLSAVHKALTSGVKLADGSVAMKPYNPYNGCVIEQLSALTTAEPTTTEDPGTATSDDATTPRPPSVLTRSQTTAPGTTAAGTTAAGTTHTHTSAAAPRSLAFATLALVGGSMLFAML